MTDIKEYKKLLKQIEKWSFDEAIEIPAEIYKKMLELLSSSSP